MSDSKLFLLIGAIICTLIGVYIGGMTAFGLFTQQIRSVHDFFVAGCLVVYALLAFVPFCAFIYPRIKATRKLVFFGFVVIEILVLALFLWACVPKL